MDPTQSLADLDPHDLCKEVELDFDLLASLDISLFGVSLNVDTPIVPDIGLIAGGMLAKINTVLAPLTPIFDFIDILLLLKDVLEAVVTLNPFAIGKAVEKFLKLLDKLKAYIPQLAIPRTIKGVLGVLVALLIGFRAELRAIIAAQSKIVLAKAKAERLGDLSFAISIECAEANAKASLDVMKANAEPLNRLLSTINIFCSIAGLPELPTLTIDPNGGAEEALAPIDALIELLMELRAAIPG